MNEETKPSILLSLPPELWHQIMRATDDCHEDDDYIYVTLRHAALAHRILQPYAQEELLRTLSVGSEEQLITLVESLRGSRRLEEYAKRTESIELYLMEGKGLKWGEGERLNELVTTVFDMCYNSKRFHFQNMEMRLSTIARLTNLRDLVALEIRINIDQPTAPLAGLTQLHFCDTRFVDGNGNECDHDLLRSLFSPAQLPALRRISIDDIAFEQDFSRFNLILPQLIDIEFCCIPPSVVASQLPHCTSLKTLRLKIFLDDQLTDLVPFFNSLRDLNLVDFFYCDRREDDREASLRNIRSIMAIVGEMKTLKVLSLAIDGINEGGESMMKWREFKGEVRKTCQKNKVKMIRYNDDDGTLERHELTWVD